jgi:ABC-type Na+ efflux pump permease subunit
MAFMILLWISVFTGGQFLLTSTIEEKSNRIMEVLLSAVSPLELMVGKILGQMGAGMLILVLYSCAGITGLVVSQRTHLVDWSTLALVVVYFFLAYGFISCMMAAVGSAVNDIHEAQALIGPLMMVIIAPMILMNPIIMDPQGVLATTMSFIPGVSPFVMVLRICSSQPPPIWQIAATIILGAVTVVICAKFAAKIFRIGVLMYGKPPNFATFIRWIRMA